MKKRWITAVAMLLALLMLCSCGWSAPEPDVEAVPFEEMVYTRPDLSEMDALMAEPPPGRSKRSSTSASTGITPSPRCTRWLRSTAIWT